MAGSPNQRICSFQAVTGTVEPMTRQTMRSRSAQDLRSHWPADRRESAQLPPQPGHQHGASGLSLRTVARFTGHTSLEQLRRSVDVIETDELAALELIS